MKERGITLWDALLQSNLNVTEKSKISIQEFKCILKSLNVSLNLKEKLLIIKFFDPKSEGFNFEFKKKI